MIHDLILPKVKERIEADVSFLANNEVQISTDQRVKAKHGKKYCVSLYPGPTLDGESPDIEGGLDLELSFFAGLTLRAHDVPPDLAWERAYSLVATGFERAIRGIYLAIRGKRWELACSINSAAETAGVDWRVIRPFRYVGGGAQVQEVGADHFNADDTRKGKPLDVRNSYGFFVPLEFTGRVMARNYDESHVLIY